MLAMVQLRMVHRGTIHYVARDPVLVENQVKSRRVVSGIFPRNIFFILYYSARHQVLIWGQMWYFSLFLSSQVRTMRWNILCFGGSRFGIPPLSSNVICCTNEAFFLRKMTRYALQPQTRLLLHIPRIYLFFFFHLSSIFFVFSFFFLSFYRAVFIREFKT